MTSREMPRVMTPKIDPMHSSTIDFARDLELFRTEAESAIQFFYAWDVTHVVAATDPKVRRLLNEAPLFWNTALGALQASTLVALGRVFDPNPKNFSVAMLLATAHANLEIFSKTALADRKRKQSANADDWLPEYLKTVYEPTTEDFRRLKNHVQVRRKTYEEKYRPIRHKVFAHRGVFTREEVNDLFANTNLQELRQLLIFLRRLHETLWQLYFNGHKPLLRPARYSVQNMLDSPSPNPKWSTLQERLVHEVHGFLQRHAQVG
jgi:hypothetical protein